LKIDNLSTQLGAQLESKIDESWGLSSRAGYATRTTNHKTFCKWKCLLKRGKRGNLVYNMVM